MLIKTNIFASQIKSYKHLKKEKKIKMKKRDQSEKKSPNAKCKKVPVSFKPVPPLRGRVYTGRLPALAP